MNDFEEFAFTENNDNQVRISLDKDQNEALGHRLQELLWVKKTLKKTLFKVMDYPYSENLAEALEEYFIITHRQVKRLEEIFEFMHMNVEVKKTKDAADVFTAILRIINENGKGSLRDKAIVSSLHKIEQVEIVALNALCLMAGNLGEEKIEAMLFDILEEDKMVDVGFAQIAEVTFVPRSN